MKVKVVDGMVDGVKVEMVDGMVNGMAVVLSGMEVLLKIVCLVGKIDLSTLSQGTLLVL